MKDGATPRALDVICIGRAAVDLYGEQIGARLEDVTTFARYLGGSPANTAVGCARLGLRAAMLTRVGDEQNGRFVLDSLAREGVDVSHVRLDPQRLTALVFLSIRSRTAFPLLFYRDHCADMALEASDVDPRFIASATSVLISGTHLSQPGTYAACRAAIEAARAAGGRVILDIDFRPVLWGLAPLGDGETRYVQAPSRQREPAGDHCNVRSDRRHGRRVLHRCEHERSAGSGHRAAPEVDLHAGAEAWCARLHDLSRAARCGRDRGAGFSDRGF